MTIKNLEELLPSEEELIEAGALDEELEAREAAAQHEADGLEDANIAG